LAVAVRATLETRSGHGPEGEDGPILNQAATRIRRPRRSQEDIQL